MKYLLSLLGLLPLFCTAQKASESVKNKAQYSIYFDTTLTWQQVLEKAKVERKYVFIDFHATWCAPCKMMDKFVYVDTQVADLANEKFISIKVQADTSKSDNEHVKNWYPVSRELVNQFKISSLPAYVFVSSDGSLLHKEIGYKNVSSFLTTLNNALDSNRQVFRLVKDYLGGNKNYLVLPYVIDHLTALKEDSLATTIRRDYLHNFLYTFSDTAFFSKELIFFIAQNMRSVEEKGFTFFYNSQKRIDSIVAKPGYANAVVENIVIRHFYSKILNNEKWGKGSPNWKKLYLELKTKYKKDIAKRVVLGCKIRWYTARKDDENSAINYLNRNIKYGMDTSVVSRYLVNNFIWSNVFLKCEKRKALRLGLRVVEKLLEFKPVSIEHLDTYANLLYKLGKRRAAIKWERKAWTMEEESAEKEKRAPHNIYKETLDKMVKGESTWKSQ